MVWLSQPAEGDRVFTLTGAEHPYRIMLETMNEGAVTLSSDGTILYCNQRFADIVEGSLEESNRILLLPLYCLDRPSIV